MVKRLRNIVNIFVDFYVIIVAGKVMFCIFCLWQIGKCLKYGAAMDCLYKISHRASRILR